MLNTGIVCNGCGAYCSHAPGLTYYCTNPKCTYDRDQAKAMLDKMHRIADNAGALQARITALEASLAEAEGRVIAEVVAWLRHPDRRKLIEVEPAKPGYWTNDDEPEWVFSRSALKRLPNHKDFATALETGDWKKE